MKFNDFKQLIDRTSVIGIRGCVTSDFGAYPEGGDHAFVISWTNNGKAQVADFPEESIESATVEGSILRMRTLHGEMMALHFLAVVPVQIYPA